MTNQSLPTFWPWHKYSEVSIMALEKNHIESNLFDTFSKNWIGSK